MELQVLSIYSANNGFLDEVAVEDVLKYEAGMHAFIKANYPAVLEAIREKGAMGSSEEESLVTGLKKYTEDFLAAVSAGEVKDQTEATAASVKTGDASQSASQVSA